MNAIEFLCAEAPGFAQLADHERTEILHFALLWSFFEAKVLRTNASSNRILAIVHEWAAEGKLDAAIFSDELFYFRHRYAVGENAESYLNGLNLRANDNPEMVNAVLRGQNTDAADSVSAILIIVYRLRNNLFHGNKWEYEIQGQFSNFQYANRALISALNTHGRMHRA